MTFLSGLGSDRSETTTARAPMALPFREEVSRQQRPDLGDPERLLAYHETWCDGHPAPAEPPSPNMLRDALIASYQRVLEEDCRRGHRRRSGNALVPTFRGRWAAARRRLRDRFRQTMETLDQP